MSNNEKKKRKSDNNPYNIKKILSDLKSEKTFALSETGGYGKTIHSMHDKMGTKSVVPSIDALNYNKKSRK